MTTPKETPSKITALMKSNLLSVFNERDPLARRAAIEATYTTGLTFHDPDATTYGHDAVDKLSGGLLDKNPGWVFKPDGPVFLLDEIFVLQSN
ncbi:hypothetical protein M7I_7992 [Glarea lozoyensis 74030]|uniref:SnoaL-like domain-containing protein n=1 Tax=Glarea lozoyensis (strain ATCC 74030 / MF5533) TaxID=1104152 RepID=H0EYT2_GLAL7|nr:hypothetical protein M7I_7992 [Glarea lozoyensis 74030]